MFPVLSDLVKHFPSKHCPPSRALALPALAGAFGALGGVCGKGVGADLAAGPARWLFHGACVTAMLACNELGGVYFARALAAFPSRMATVVSTVASFAWLLDAG